jgi:DNA uptake protein ComE-like DNA-binding protein
LNAENFRLQEMIVKLFLSLLALFSYVVSGSVLAAPEADPAESPPTAATPAKLDLNSAPAEALRKLQGITDARAKAIIEGRCYTTKAQLVDRRIIPNSVYEKIKDQLEISKDRECVRGLPAAAAEVKNSAK